MQVAIARMSYLTAFVVSIINSIMPYVLRAFSLFEKHETKTDLSLNLAGKLTLLKFLNTSVIFTIVH